MIPNMRFYVISIVAIFAALGIGIYIGFALDTQSFVVEQRDDIVQKLEERFDFLKNENEDLKSLIKEIEIENEYYKVYVESTYEELLKNRISNLKISIIETVDDYIYSGLGQILESAGGEVVNVVTINKKITDENLLKNVYMDLGIKIDESNLVPKTSVELTRSIIQGEDTDLIKKLEEKQLINILGSIDEPVDYIILAGGSIKENKDRINLIDKHIIKTIKNMNIDVIGVEKSNVSYSYMENYKKLRINTVDNIDMAIGKVSLILAMEGRPGHYGIKPTAEIILPNIKLPLIESKER